MTPLGYALLTDENIQDEVVIWLRQHQLDVRTVFDEGLASQSDQEILRCAYSQGRVVLTHDSDFGALAIHRGEPFIGIIYLRPGHRDAAFTIGTLRTLQASSIDVHPPFIAVVERRADETRVRVRHAAKDPR